MTEQSKRDSDSKHTILRCRRLSDEQLFDPEKQTFSIQKKGNIRTSGDEFIIDPDTDTYQIKNDRKNKHRCCKGRFISISPKTSTVFILFIVAMLLVYIYQNELGFTQVIEAIQRKTLSDDYDAAMAQILPFVNGDHVRAREMYYKAQNFFGRFWDSRLCGRDPATKYRIYARIATAKRVVIDFDGTAAATSKIEMTAKPTANDCAECKQKVMTTERMRSIWYCWNLELDHFALEYWNDDRADVRFYTASGYGLKGTELADWQLNLKGMIKEESNSHYKISLKDEHIQFVRFNDDGVFKRTTDIFTGDAEKSTVAIDDDARMYEKQFDFAGDKYVDKLSGATRDETLQEHSPTLYSSKEADFVWNRQAVINPVLQRQIIIKKDPDDGGQQARCEWCIVL